MAPLLRLSGPAIALGAVLVIVTVSFGDGIGPLYLAGVALLVLGLVGQVLRTRRQRPAQEQEPLLIGVPVAGRWRGLNSPASKVPSHTHGLAQTYALDITHEPPGSPPRAMDWLWPPMRRPQEFPSFGRPVLAPFDGEVVAARGGEGRDHLTRLSPLGLIVMLVEGLVRSLGAPRHLLGTRAPARGRRRHPRGCEGRRVGRWGSGRLGRWAGPRRHARRHCGGRAGAPASRLAPGDARRSGWSRGSNSPSAGTPVTPRIHTCTSS